MRDEESNEGVTESFDLENLFKEVVPNLLNSSGNSPPNFDMSKKSF
jgi:hypothetical protein